MPILACAMHAVEGILRSGVEVDTMMRSISFGSRPAAAIAFSPAHVARSDVYSSGAATRRWRIPSVSTTHSGEVGRSPMISSFVRILAGTYEPVDLMRTLSNRQFRFVMVPFFNNAGLSILYTRTRSSRAAYSNASSTSEISFSGFMSGPQDVMVLDGQGASIRMGPLG